MNKSKRRRLPHLEIEGSYYHLVFQLKIAKLSNAEIVMVLKHIREGHEKYYRLIAAQIMPDHAHLILQPIEGYSLPRVMKGIKSTTARMINRFRNRTGSVWKENYFDRIIRSPKDLDEKLNYMLENPIRAGLVEDGWDYLGWFFNEM